MSQITQTPANQRTDGMNKSQLQELCQKRSWPLPEYQIVKEGPLHALRFKATVIVNGLPFESSGSFNRSKDAQIEAAKLALSHFASSAPEGTSSASVTNIASPATENCASEGVSNMSIDLNKNPVADEIRTPIVKEVVQISEKTLETKLNKPAGELHIYKNQLQSFAMKKGYGLPVYTFEREGPPHSSCFKSKVIINGQVYESPRFFSTLKESEHAAAKVALLSLVPPESQEAIIDKSVLKNLLQELAQKSGKKLPIYSTTGSGASHMPTFVSTVFVDGEAFLGGEAKTKKLAEMNAAEVAYTHLSQRENSGPSGCKSISSPKSESALSLPSYNTSKSGGTYQIGAPSKLIMSPTDAGSLKGSNEEAPKQIQPIVVSTHATPKELPNHIPLSQGKCPSPIIPSDASNDSVSVSNPDSFPVSSSPHHDVIRIYPRMPNMEFPVGAVVQHTDDKWIAVRFPASKTGH